MYREPNPGEERYLARTGDPLLPNEEQPFLRFTIAATTLETIIEALDLVTRVENPDDPDEGVDLRIECRRIHRQLSKRSHVPVVWRLVASGPTRETLIRESGLI